MNKQQKYFFFQCGWQRIHFSEALLVFLTGVISMRVFYMNEQGENALKILFLKARGGYFLPAACAVTVRRVFTLKCLSLKIFIQRIPSTSLRKTFVCVRKETSGFWSVNLLQRSGFLLGFVGWSLLAFKPRCCVL